MTTSLPLEGGAEPDAGRSTRHEPQGSPTARHRTMNLFVLLKTVPDTVEELSVAADGKSLDAEWLRFKLGDADEHALEQALLLKEKHGGTLTVVALDAPELDDSLFTVLAKEI